MFDSPRKFAVVDGSPRRQAARQETAIHEFNTRRRELARRDVPQRLRLLAARPEEAKAWAARQRKQGLMCRLAMLTATLSKVERAYLLQWLSDDEILDALASGDGLASLLRLLRAKVSARRARLAAELETKRQRAAAAEKEQDDHDAYAPC